MNNLGASLLVVIILIVLNGIFSAGEFAIISSRKSRIRDIIKAGDEKRGRILLDMRENPEKFLSTVQIGITIFATLASAIAGALSVSYVQPMIRQVPYLAPFAETISLVLVVLVLTYFIIVFGELMPKNIGINYRERVAVVIVPVFELFSKVFFFLIYVLNFTTASIFRLLRLKKREDAITEDEIKLLLEEGRLKGIFDKTEEELIHSVFNFADRSVKEIMVPRPNIYGVDLEKPREEMVKYIIENQFSRYPVYRDHQGNILGIIYQKDLMKYIWLNQPFDLEKLLKKPYFVPDGMKISALMKDMQKRRIHLAVVVDEYGTTVGIVSLEDIMEEIFGEIMDETDTEVGVERLPDGSTIVDGATSIRDLNSAFGLGLDEQADYETLGGFLLTRLQGMPRGGEIVHEADHRFTVVGIEGRRISKVKIDKVRPQSRQPKKLS
jgi:putative hemolysin